VRPRPRLGIRIPAPRRAAVAACALTILLAASPPPAPLGREASHTPVAVAPGWIETARREIAAREYRFSLQSDGGWGAPNREQNLRARVGEAGITLSRRDPGAGAPASLSLTISLEEFGRPTRMVPVGIPEAAASGERAWRRWPHMSLTEWYVNRPEGIEHGFTIEAAPGFTQGPLVLEMAYPSHLRAAVTEDGATVRFTSADGSRVLDYSGLKSFDRAGRLLSCRLEAHRPGRMRILVEDAGADYPITVDPLFSTPVWTGEPNLADSFFGISVAGAGDIDADGFDDVIVGASEFDGGLLDEGKVFVYRGTAGGLVLHAEMEGNLVDAEFGRAVAGGCDVNGDGFDDIIVGAPFYDNPENAEGRVFVYIGSATGLANPPVAIWTGESNQAAARYGWSVACAGDVDNNGRDEIVIGAPLYENDPPGGADETNEGRVWAYVWTGAPAMLTLGWTGESNQGGAQLGYSVGSGRFNGDLFSDLIVGAPFWDVVAADDRGAALVWHGSAAGPPLPSGIPGNASWSAASTQVSSRFGWSVASALDLDADGFHEAVVGAPLYDFPDANEGRVSVFRGGAGGLGAVPAWTAESNVAGAQLGYSVAAAGDVDGDGFADLLAGAPFHSGVGRAFLWRGSATGPPGLPAVPAGTSANAAWQAQSDQAGAQFGFSVARAGDVNKDMKDDVIVGALLYDNPEVDEGRAYLYLGGFMPPGYLEFGARGDPRRIEAVASGYGSVRGLVGGEYELSGSASVAMSGCAVPADCTRPFSFAAVHAVADPADTASNGAPAFRVTSGGALVAMPATPIIYPRTADLDLSLYSFTLDPTGGVTEPAAEVGGMRKGLWLELHDKLTSAAGQVLLLAPVAVEQDLDFPPLAAAIDWLGVKDFPFRVAPQSGVLWSIKRDRIELGSSDFVHLGKERGELVATVDRCAATGACLADANDGIFGLHDLPACNWDLNHFAGIPSPGSVGTPFVQSGGLRATLWLNCGGGGGTYSTLFPAGASLTLSHGSRIELADTEPAGGSLVGSLALTVRTGAMYVDDATIQDCTGEQSLLASFGGATMQPGGRLVAPGLSPLLGWSELSWGGDGTAVAGSYRGFFVGDLASAHLSFFSPDTVARGAGGTAVQDTLLASIAGGFGEGTFAGLNIAKLPADGTPMMTTGVDVPCPAPAGGAHSFEAGASRTRLYARLGGVTGIADAGAMGPMAFPYMGYDLTLKRFGGAYLDNVPTHSGVSAERLDIPDPSDVAFDFALDSRVTLKPCGDFGALGDLADPGQEQTLSYWGADFEPWAVEFRLAGGSCAAEDPPGCAPLDDDETQIVHVDSTIPLDLEPRDPARRRFADEVSLDVGPAPAGHLICTDIPPVNAAGIVRNEFEPDYGFHAEIEGVTLEPTLNPNQPPDSDAAARYEVDGQFHLPFYMGRDAGAVVRGGFADLVGSLGDFSSKVAVAQEVFGGLFDLSFDLEYFRPQLPEVPARLMAGKGNLDLGLIDLPVSVKLFGKDPLGTETPAGLEHPEIYLGFLSDLAAYSELKADNPLCDTDPDCRAALRELGGFADIAEMDQMLPALQAAQSQLPIGNLKRMIAKELDRQIGSLLPADVAAAAGRIKGVVNGVRSGVEAFKTLDLTGPGAFDLIDDHPEALDFVLDRIDISADVEIAEFIDFDGYVRFNRHTADFEDCRGRHELVDITIGATDVDLGWLIDGVRARLIEGVFHFDTAPVSPWGFDGSISVAGIRFGDVILDELGLFLGMGDPPCGSEDYYYLGGSGTGRYKAATASGGFFIGKSVDMTPIVRIDPDVGQFLEGLTAMDGIYIKGEASFPIFSGPECAPYRLTGGGGGAFWLFSQGPTLGTKLHAYATGSLACVVSARADMTLLGGLQGDIWKLAGHGFAAGGVGSCEPTEWDTRRDVLNDDWCLACVLSGEFRTDSRRRDFEGTLDGPDCN